MRAGGANYLSAACDGPKVLSLHLYPWRPHVLRFFASAVTVLNCRGELIEANNKISGIGFRAGAIGVLGGVVVLATAVAAQAVVAGAWTTGNVQFVNNCQVAAVLQPNAAGTLKRGAADEVSPCTGEVHARVKYTEFGITTITSWASSSTTAYTNCYVSATVVQPGH